MKKTKLFAVAVLVAAAAFTMAACGGNKDKENDVKAQGTSAKIGNLVGTTWSGFFPGDVKEGVKVVFETNDRARLIETETVNGIEREESDTYSMEYKYNGPNGVFKTQYSDGSVHTFDFVINGDEMILNGYAHAGSMTLKRRN